MHPSREVGRNQMENHPRRPGYAKRYATLRSHSQYPIHHARLVMGVIDKYRFETRGGQGCSNSDYKLNRVTCCGEYCVEDDELLDLYLDPNDLSRTFQLYVDAPCPFCGATTWDYNEVEELNDVPPSWQWAAYLR